MSDLIRRDLEGALWREYEFLVQAPDSPGGVIVRRYRIENPVAFWYRPEGSTHRVLDKEGVVHVVPAPGYQGCVLRYRKAEGFSPVVF